MHQKKEKKSSGNNPRNPKKHEKLKGYFIDNGKGRELYFSELYMATTAIDKPQLIVGKIGRVLTELSSGESV